mmetsp:Transcript_15122/g.22165  ORF Transcript_15122/g.22165 Transcript_15122/m.22165 type:complete len:131 (-) Transcript_15122:57-449(-)
MVGMDSLARNNNNNDYACVLLIMKRKVLYATQDNCLESILTTDSKMLVVSPYKQRTRTGVPFSRNSQLVKLEQLARMVCCSRQAFEFRLESLCPSEHAAMELDALYTQQQTRIVSCVLPSAVVSSRLFLS